MILYLRPLRKKSACIISALLIAVFLGACGRPFDVSSSSSESRSLSNAVSSSSAIISSSVIISSSNEEISSSAISVSSAIVSSSSSFTQRSSGSYPVNSSSIVSNSSADITSSSSYQLSSSLSSISSSDFSELSSSSMDLSSSSIDSASIDSAMNSFIIKHFIPVLEEFEQAMKTYYIENHALPSEPSQLNFLHPDTSIYSLYLSNLTITMTLRTVPGCTEISSTTYVPYGQPLTTTRTFDGCRRYYPQDSTFVLGP